MFLPFSFGILEFHYLPPGIFCTKPIAFGRYGLQSPGTFQPQPILEVPMITMFDKTTLKKVLLVAVCGMALSACSSAETPRIVQASAGMPEVRLTNGMATQIEMPSQARVQSIVVGNPSLVSADRTDDIVNLTPKEGSGETNLIVRAVDEDGHAQVYQYRVIVSGQ